MIEYKRFISYIYAYAGGVRDKNTGFAKAQVQRSIYGYTGIYECQFCNAKRGK